MSGFESIGAGGGVGGGVEGPASFLDSILAGPQLKKVIAILSLQGFNSPK